MELLSRTCFCIRVPSSGRVFSYNNTLSVNLSVTRVHPSVCFVLYTLYNIMGWIFTSIVTHSVCPLHAVNMSSREWV
jgi:hypothetical protein